MNKRILMLLLMLTVLLGVFTLTASAAEIIASGTCSESLTWELNADGNLHISGTGEMYSFSFGGSAWYAHQDDIRSVTIDEGVTSIGANAFMNCINFTSVTIPDSVTSIGPDAFNTCRSLTSVTIPGNVTSIDEMAFANCTSLTNVTIPDGVSYIGWYSFSGCTSLTSITIPTSVTFISEDAFSECPSLINVYYSGTQEQWDAIEIGDYNDALLMAKPQTAIWNYNDLTMTLTPDGSLRISGSGDMPNYLWEDRFDIPWYARAETIKAVTIDENVTSIGDFAFIDCKNLRSIKIPASVTSIGEHAFFECTGLESINIPAGVTSIGEHAFFECTGLESINIPAGVTSIGDSAFFGCEKLTCITIPEGVTSIGDDTFYACTSLSSITIPSSITSIGNRAFVRCPGLTQITIPNGVTSIGEAAFAECTGLSRITIPASVTSIGIQAFSCPIYVDENNANYSSDHVGSLYSKDKTNLIRVPTTISGRYTMDTGVTSVDVFSFSGCNSLTRVNIAAGVTSIGYWAFNDCTNLISITIPTSVTYIAMHSFNNCNNLTDVYYAGTEEQWNAIENHSADDDLAYDGLSHAAIHFVAASDLPATPDVSTSLAHSEFVQQVESAKEDAYIVADYSGEATLPETAFNAIAGTDKTLDLVSDGVTWRFSGNDIVNEVKPIDLKVEIMPVEEHPSDAAQEIQTALEDKPAVVMQFPENGTLPGKATIQVKVDQAMQEYLGSNQALWVYYFNNQTGELELIAKDLVVVDGTYVEFSITHCSNYVLTKSEHKFPFTDVRNGMWYLNPVFWAVNNKITAGVSETSFAPDATCTRAQIVTFLWRACGSPEPTSSSNPFWDVSSSDYFYKAVLWAVEKGITSGTSATTFSPDAGCTRGQVATFLWRAEGEPASGAENIFTDITPGAYYYDAVLWAVEQGITNGVGKGLFAPDATCTRGQIVTFLYRAMV